MNTYSNKEHRCLNDLSPKDRHLFLINDLIELLKDTILDYLITNNNDEIFEHELREFNDEIFEHELREFMKTLTTISNKVYNKESDVMKNKDDKDNWLLTALFRDEIARQAFHDYITHTH